MEFPILNERRKFPYTEKKNRMRLQFKIRPIRFSLQFGDLEIIRILDHLIPLMKSDPDRFKIKEHYLLDTDTEWEYWIGNSTYQSQVWRPEKSNEFGIWQGYRFRRAWKKYILIKNKNYNGDSKFFVRWKSVYLNDSKPMSRSDFIEIYNDHLKYRKNNPTLIDLWEKYLACYYLISGREK